MSTQSHGEMIFFLLVSDTISSRAIISNNPNCPVGENHEAELATEKSSSSKIQTNLFSEGMMDVS